MITARTPSIVPVLAGLRPKLAAGSPPCRLAMVTLLRQPVEQLVSAFFFRKIKVGLRGAGEVPVSCRPTARGATLP